MLSTFSICLIILSSLLIDVSSFKILADSLYSTFPSGNEFTTGAGGGITFVRFGRAITLGGGAAPLKLLTYGFVLTA